MTVPVEQGGRETAFQGLDRAADLSELRTRPPGRAAAGPRGKVATATNLGGLGLGRAQ